MGLQVLIFGGPHPVDVIVRDLFRLALRHHDLHSSGKVCLAGPGFRTSWLMEHMFSDGSKNRQLKLI